MGLYDTFVDGKKEIQLKNFDCCMAEYKVGCKVNMKEFGYPKNGLFFCFCVHKSGFAVIQNNKFIGIVDSIWEHPKMRIWDCWGYEYERKPKGKVKQKTGETHGEEEDKGHEMLKEMGK